MKRRVRLIGCRPQVGALDPLRHARILIARKGEALLWSLKKEAETVWRQVQEQETPSRLHLTLPSGPRTIEARAHYDQIAARWYEAALALEMLVERYGFTQRSYDKHVAQCRASTPHFQHQIF